MTSRGHRGLNLDRVVLLGRTFAEYLRFFGLSVEDLRAASILDVAAGVSSFTAEIYPTTTFEGEPSAYLARLESEPQLGHLEFQIVPTEFEFLVNSNNFLRARHREAASPSG